MYRFLWMLFAPRIVVERVRNGVECLPLLMFFRPVVKTNVLAIVPSTSDWRPSVQDASDQHIRKVGQDNTFFEKNKKGIRIDTILGVLCHG